MLLLPLALAQDISIHESLAHGSSATTVYGGTFTGSGWRVDDSNSRLYWDFGTLVNRGSVSFVTDGITWDNLTGDNNEFIQLFDTGDKWSCTRAVTVRVYGDITGDSWGDIKLKVWDDTAGDFLVAEARGGTQEWDGLPHLWTVTWDSSTATLSRDGVMLIELDTTGMDLSVGTMWLPLNAWSSGYSHPIGSTYSNLAFDGWLPGSDDDPVWDDSDPLSFLPIEDAGVLASESGVSRWEDDLPVQGEGGANVEASYLMFDLSSVSGTVASARLHLHVPTDDSSGGSGGEVRVVGDTGWDEDTLTWGSRPSAGAVVASWPDSEPGDEFELDVTSAVTTGGRVALALTGTGDDGAHFASKEYGDGSMAPLLKLTLAGEDEEEPSEEEPEGDTDAGEDPSGDEADEAPDDTGAAREAPDGKRGALGGEGGCGCAGTGGGASLLGLVAGLLVRRARSQPPNPLHRDNHPASAPRTAS